MNLYFKTHPGIMQVSVIVSPNSPRSVTLSFALVVKEKGERRNAKTGVRVINLLHKASVISSSFFPFWHPFLFLLV